jgi:hypothetical protein
VRDAVVVLRSDASGGLAREAAPISAHLVFSLERAVVGSLPRGRGGAKTAGDDDVFLVVEKYA